MYRLNSDVVSAVAVDVVVGAFLFLIKIEIGKRELNGRKEIRGRHVTS